jgi:hypothetical protein
MQILMLKNEKCINTIFCIVVIGKGCLHHFIDQMILILCRMASCVQNEVCVISGKIDSPFLVLTDMI